ncbi:MAG: hypothetical protein ACP5VR_13510 [Acidimicrobiales bacterium]
MTRTELHQIVDDLPEEAIDGAPVILRELATGAIGPDRAWVWEPEWQAKLKSALDDLVAGRVTRFDNDEDLLAAV